MLKKLFSAAIAFVLMFSIMALPANAATNDVNNIPVNHNKSIQSNKFEIPTLQLGEKQSHEVVLSNGEIGVITVEKIADFTNDKKDIEGPVLYGWSRWHTRKNVTDGTYKINVVTAAANAGFAVDIRNYRITSAYDPWHFMAISNVSGTLTHDSSKKATYFMNFSMAIPWVGGPSWTGGVQARIEGRNLVTYWD
ncbi:DUF5626 family protein [Anaerococcus nagyae]|uniref:DUF5626 family protein n=1 Tax=Anaerococcus nagyae TaxID=1755241 RepID=UPI0037356FB5